MGPCSIHIQFALFTQVVWPTLCAVPNVYTPGICAQTALMQYFAGVQNLAMTAIYAQV